MRWNAEEKTFSEGLRGHVHDLGGVLGREPVLKALQARERVVVLSIGALDALL